MSESLPRGLAYYKLLEALKEPGCPICRLGRANVEAYLENLLYENVNDPGVRENILAARGFCSFHAYQLVKIGDALGLGIIYNDLVLYTIQQLGTLTSSLNESRFHGSLFRRKKERDKDRLTRLPFTLRRDQSFSHRYQELNPRAPCPACEKEREAVRRYCEELMAWISSAEMEEAYQSSEGLCLGHLRQCLALTQAATNQQLAAAREKLIHMELHILKDLAADLAELLRKFDYRYSREPMGKEKDAWRRAMAKISGIAAWERDELNRDELS